MAGGKDQYKVQTRERPSCSDYLIALCETSVDSVIIVDQDLIVQNANEALFTMFGYDMVEILGESVLQLFEADAADLAENLDEQAYLTRMMTGRHSDGATFPVEVAISRFVIDEQPTYMYLVRHMGLAVFDYNSAQAQIAALSPRQRQILQMVARGNTSREIAEALTISVKTVETHRANLMNKLDVRNVTGLVRIAVEIGLA